jgi:hypothetical protein
LLVGSDYCHEDPSQEHGFIMPLQQAADRGEIPYSAACQMDENLSLVSELDDLRSSAQRGRPYGSEDWMIKIAKQVGLESTMHSRGRPKHS